MTRAKKSFQDYYCKPCKTQQKFVRDGEKLTCPTCGYVTHLSCTVVRTVLVRTSTINLKTMERSPVSEDWKTGPCGGPLFSDLERASGECKSCASGWTSQENYRGKSRPV